MSVKTTLYCYSGNEKVLSIDPNSLAIITLLHWNEINFELIQCCKKSESPSNELPAIVIGDTIHSGYRSIYRALKSHYSELFTDDPKSLTSREFLLQMNQDLLIEEFSNDEIFRNFTEPALLSAKSRYWWNFARSRIFPLNYQMSPISSSINQISKKSKRIEESEKIANDSTSLEIRILLFSHLIIRSLLPKQYQFDGQFADFSTKLTDELDRKEFKGKLMKKSSYKPVYKHEPVEDYSDTSHTSVLNVNAYTGLFGVICAIAILYSIKQRRSN